MSHNTQRRSRAFNSQSKLLNESENNQIFQLVGNRCVSLATAVAQVVHAEPPGHNKWNVRCTGVLCFIKDNPQRSYYIRAYDLNTNRMVYEQEIYNQLKYHKKLAYFHTYEGDNCPIGINFANEEEASIFHQAVDEKLFQRKKRREERKRPNASQQGAPVKVNTAAPTNTAPSIPTVGASSGKDTLKKKDKDKKKGKKGKLTKEQIGTPTDFRHVGHVGWDPDKGFDMDNLDPSLQTLFKDVGLSEDQLQDKETATFIYDFIEKHGGVEALKREQTVRRDVPPLPVAPPVPMGNAPPPPPPPSNRVVGPPPPPAQSRNVPPPPPPSRAPQSAPPPPPNRSPMVSSNRGMAAPPPPPPPSRHGGAPPPPPPISSAAPPPPPPPAIGGPPAPPPPPPPTTGTAPPPNMARNALLSEIQTGTSLKHVDATERSPAPSDGRGALLDAIRGGITLNKVDPAEMEQRRSVDPSVESQGGLAGALARALKDRAKVVQDDEDSEEEVEDDDDEWED